MTDTALEAHTIQPVTAKKIRSQTRGIVVGVCMAFLLMLSNLAFGAALLTQQNDYHNASIAKSNEIIAIQNEHANTLTQVKKLAMEIDGLVALVPGATVALKAGQQQLIDQLAALCAATGAKCPPMP